MSLIAFAACRKKKRYLILAAAEFAAQEVSQVFGDVTIRPCRCDVCGKFHLGHSCALITARAWQQILQQRAEVSHESR
jgi:hypothetical protein